MPSSSISSSERVGASYGPPLTLSPPAEAPSRGARALLARAAALLLLAALPVAFSAWIDPARLVAPRHSEREIARTLASGANVTDFVNYDDRAIEKYLAPRRPARIDVLALGSSRMQPMPASAFPHATFVNAAMQGGMLDDVFAIYGLYDHAGRRPRHVVMTVDPWTESYDATPGWMTIADERTMVLRRSGIPVSPTRDRLVLLWRAMRTLATPEYFRLSVYSFRRYGTHNVPWRATKLAQNAEKTKLPDGTVVWSDLPADNAERVAPQFAAQWLPTDSRFRNLDRRAPGRRDALERFVRYLTSEGVTVTLVLVPFPIEVYDAFGRQPGYPVSAVEGDLRAMSKRVGSEIVGSYDPRAVGVTTRDFFDEDHLRPEALARMVARSARGESR